MTKSKTPALVLTVVVAATALTPLAQEAVGQTPVPSLTTIRLETIRSRDEDLLRDLAAALSEKYPELLAGTEILFTRVESFGTVFYRMDIQGIEGEAAARDLCKILEMEQCLVARPGASILASPEAFNVAPDGLVDMTSDPAGFGRQVSGSVDATPLPTQGSGWSPVDAIEDTLTSLPLDRPDPEALRNPALLPWEEAIASAEADAAAKAAGASGPGADMLDGVASTLSEPMASAQATPDDGASLDLDGAIEHARAGGAEPPKLALDFDAPAAPSVATGVAPAVSVSIAGSDGAPMPLPSPEANDADLAALTETVRTTEPAPSVIVQVAGPDTIRPLPRPTTGIFAQLAGASEAETEVASLEAPVAAAPAEDVSAAVVVAEAGPDTIRPRPRPTTGVFAAKGGASIVVASADGKDVGAPTNLPKPVWAAGPRPTVGAESAAPATRKAPQVVAPTLGTEVASVTGPLRSVPSPRPESATSAADGMTRTQALALAVEEARAARVAERLAQGGAPVPAPSSATTTPVLAARDEDTTEVSPASVAQNVASVDVQVAGPDTIRPRPRPTTGVFAEMAKAAPAALVAEADVQADAVEEKAEGSVGLFARAGADAAVVPGLHPALGASPALASAAEESSRPTPGTLDASPAFPAMVAHADAASSADPLSAPQAPADAPTPVRLAWALPAEGPRVSSAAGSHGAWSRPVLGGAAEAPTLALAMGAEIAPAPKAAAPTSFRFQADLALADSGDALLAFRVPRAQAFARWALGTVAFPTEGVDVALGGVLPKPVRVAAVAPVGVYQADVVRRITAVAPLLETASAEETFEAIGDTSDATVVAELTEGDTAPVGIPLPALRPQTVGAVDATSEATFASLAEAGLVAASGAPLVPTTAPSVRLAETTSPSVGALPSVAVAGLRPVDMALVGVAPAESAAPIQGVALAESDTVLASRLTALILVGTSPLTATAGQAQPWARVAGVDVAPLAVSGQDVVLTALAGVEVATGVEVLLASADTPRPRMRPTTGVFAKAVKEGAQDPVKMAALFPSLRPGVEGVPSVDTAPAQEATLVAASVHRVRPDAVPVRTDDRPIHGFLDVWGVAMPWTDVELAQGQTRTWGEVEAPVEVVDAVFSPTARLIAGEDVGEAVPFRVVETNGAQPRTLDEFVGVLTAPDVIFGVPSPIDFEALAEERRASEAERALLATAPTAAAEPSAEIPVPGLRPTADSIAAAAGMPADADLPGSIRATMGAESITMETDTRRVVVPRKAVSASRFAVVLADTYAMPFDLTGSGLPALQRMPMLRPAVVDGAGAPVAATLVAAGEDMPVVAGDPTDMSGFFPAPGSVEAAPVVADVFEQDAAPAADGMDVESAPASADASAEVPPADDAAIAMMDKLRGGLDETLTTFEIPVEAPPQEVVEAGVDASLTSDSLAPAAATAPAAPGPSRPFLDLPPLDVEGRPTAPAPLVELAQAEPAASVPVTEAPVEGASTEPRVTTFDTPNPVPFAQDSAAIGVEGAPGSTGAASPGSMAVAPNEALMIRLSYANSEATVKTIVDSLKDSFPPSLLKRGRFFGKSAPASPGLFIVGIEANTAEDMAGLVAYMQANGIPYVLSGESAAPILAPQP